jgi:hypothetical protein
MASHETVTFLWGRHTNQSRFYDDVTRISHVSIMTSHESVAFQGRRRPHPHSDRVSQRRRQVSILSSLNFMDSISPCLFYLISTNFLVSSILSFNHSLPISFSSFLYFVHSIFYQFSISLHLYLFILTFINSQFPSISRYIFIPFSIYSNLSFTRSQLRPPKIKPKIQYPGRIRSHTPNAPLRRRYHYIDHASRTLTFPSIWMAHTSKKFL